MIGGGYNLLEGQWSGEPRVTEGILQSLNEESESVRGVY